MGTTKKASSRKSGAKMPEPRIPFEVSDSTLISTKLVQRIHRGLLLCHLLEERVATFRNKKLRQRVRRGDGALVVGSTIGLGARDVVVTLGHTLLPHVSRETPLREVVERLSEPLPRSSAIVQQVELAREAASRGMSHGRTVLLLCTESEFAAKALELAESCAPERLPLVTVLHCAADGMPRATAPVIPVEAHDSIAMYRVSQEAIWRARRKGGPTIIAARDAMLQPAIAEHFESEALVHLREYMQRHGAWDEAATSRLREKLQAELDEAFAGSQLSS